MHVTGQTLFLFLDFRLIHCIFHADYEYVKMLIHSQLVWKFKDHDRYPENEHCISVYQQDMSAHLFGSPDLEETVKTWKNRLFGHLLHV